MKKSFAVFAFVCTAALLFAQETMSKFSISAFIAPAAAGNLLSADNTVSDEIAEIFRDIEVAKLGYSAGILTGFAVHKNIRLQAGVSFSDNGYTEKKRELNFIDPMPGSPTAARSIYHYYYVDVPVQVKYTFLRKNKLSFYVLAGAEANFNISNKQTDVLWYEDDKDRTTREDDLYGLAEFQKYNCSVTAGVGMDITLGEKIDLFVQPTYRQMLLPVVVDVPIERRLFSVGVSTGVTINL